jgi:hypothetical protein
MDDSQTRWSMILAYTYEFQDQQLLNLPGSQAGRQLRAAQSDLQRISAIAGGRDSRKTGEMELVPPLHGTAARCACPLSAVTTEGLPHRREAIHLILGSIDLTHAPACSRTGGVPAPRWREEETQNLPLLASSPTSSSKPHQPAGFSFGR